MKSLLKPFAAALLAAVSITGVAHAADVSGKLVLYTSQPNTDAQQTIDAFKAKHPNVDISFVRDGTPPLLAKLRAEFEAGKPQADVLLIADSVTMEGLKKEGRLEAYPEADVSGYVEGFHDPQKFWFATKMIGTGIVYNTKATFKPTSWEDLTKPEVKDQLIMPSPLASGAALIHAVSLTSNLPEGWGYYEALKKNGALASGGNGGILKSVAGGEKLYGVIVDYMPIREKAKGAPVEFVLPKEGISVVTEPVAILKNTQNPEAAKAFIDFIVSKDGQELARKQGYVSIHPDVAVPENFPSYEGVDILKFDPAKALEDETKNKKTFSDIFGQ